MEQYTDAILRVSGAKLGDRCLIEHGDEDTLSPILADVLSDEGRLPAKENARRLVAAWNVCKGIPTELLEQLADGKHERSVHVFHEQEAEGVIMFERSAYGLYVYINGKCLAQIDLFYFSPDWKERTPDDEEPHETEDRLRQGSDFPQIVIYSGDIKDDVFAHVRWKGIQVVIESDHPCSRSEIVAGPGALIQRLTVGESEGEADGK